MRDTFTTHDGSSYTVLERPRDPGDALVMSFRLRDHCGTPPLHFHPHARETFEVEEGWFEMRIDGGWRRVEAGEAISVEAGENHTFRNHSGAEVVVRNTHAPHDGFESYIRRLAALSREHEVTAPTKPAAVLAVAQLWQEYSELIRPSPLPLKLAFPLLALLARATGTKAPEPS